MLKVGLTGGIGSGKSTVANQFRLKSITVVDADKIARDAVAPDSSALQEIVEHFGQSILNEDKTLNRKKLREQVFDSQHELEWLNQCLHPKIREEIQNQVDAANSPYVVLDIPLLLENRMETLVDRILIVDVPESLQIKRVKERDNSSESLIKSIMEKQVTRKYRLSKADDVIDNALSLETLKKTIDQLHQKYLALAENEPNSAL